MNLLKTKKKELQNRSPPQTTYQTLVLKFLINTSINSTTTTNIGNANPGDYFKYNYLVALS